MKRKLIQAALLLSVVGVTTAIQARADVVNFDQYASPPVACCYGSTGVTGPLVYPHVTIMDGNGAGSVMNGSGWDNEQTSGNNLFGTESGTIVLTFNVPVSNLVLDVINGTSASSFTLNGYDQTSTLLGADTQSLNSYTSPGSVSTFSLNFGDIWSATVVGNGDFAVDTISFNTGTTPEPGFLGILVAGVATLFASKQRRHKKNTDTPQIG
jgi:hypothetical protein